MSVTLFYCSQCDSYSTSAMVNMTVHAILSPTRSMLCVDSDASWPEGYSIPLEDIVESRCSECDEPSKLVTLDECPHRWQTLYSDPSRRVCAFCGEMQQGCVVFLE